MTDVTRRDFLAASALVAGGLAGGRAQADEPAGSPPRQPGPNEKVVLGFIGVGGMGTGLLKIFKAFPDVEVAAVCDVYEPHRLRAKDEAGGRPSAHKDFREVLDRKDIDAVVVATPDHWHAIPTILACQAGKDVYCEKPLAFRIAEGRAMVEAATRHKCVTQMGNLIHATENYRRVVEIVRSGDLGKISKTRVWLAADRQAPEGLGNPTDSDPPQGLDWDLWLGPAPRRPYNANRCIFNFRYFWDYAGGILTDFCCHIVDLVHWAMEVDAPETITATGGRYALRDNGETPDTLEVAYHYAPGFDMIWSQTDASSHGFEGRGLGIMFQGTNATLVANYETFQLFPEKRAKQEIELPPPSLPRSPGHHREWVDAIRSRAQCSCHFEYGHRLTTVGHLGNIALWTGEKLHWDARSERVTNHEGANRFLNREVYRAPWTLPTA
jgi:predicted dehydrogenase